MPIDVARVDGAELPATRASWDADDVILYHLALGAGADPTDPRELAYADEARLRVLPTFAVTRVFGTLEGLAALDGYDVDPAALLHGEQDLEVHAPVPVDGEIATTGRVSGVYDKGSGALVVVETRSTGPDGGLLFVNRFSCFLRGEGGFGGESGPPAGHRPPEREPDVEVACPTLPQQALLYRLTGDRNPLHADPEHAARAGFDRPILHGLCSFGIAAKAATDVLLDGDVTRIARVQARFAGVVFPGETLAVRMWREDDRVVLAASTKERGTPVLANAAITFRSDA